MRCSVLALAMSLACYTAIGHVAPQGASGQPQVHPLSPVAPEVLTQFDFLDGVWDFTYSAVSRNGGPPQTSKGEWTGHKTANGWIVEDSFIFRDAVGNLQPTGIYTFRVYNRISNKWNYRSVNTATGLWQEGTAEKVGDELHVLQTPPKEQAGAPLLRIRYYNIQPDRFSWSADASLDGGQTWISRVATIEASRPQTHGRRSGATHSPAS